MTVAIDICKNSQIVDGDQGHFDEMGKRVIVSEFGQILSIVNRGVFRGHVETIGVEKMPIDLLSFACSS